MNTAEKPLYTLIPLDEFKAVLGIDDREDKLARFCLVTATFTIEQYCQRRLLLKKHFEFLDYHGDLVLTLKEYPISEILAAYTLRYHDQRIKTYDLLEPDFYELIPDCGADYNLPFMLSLSPAVARLGCSLIKVIYWAGYVVNPLPCGFTTMEFASQTPTKAMETAASMPPVPGDLAAACMELAAWNMNRYRGRRVGMTGNVRGSGKEGEHFEMSMPENVRGLLEPYKRRVI